MRTESDCTTDAQHGVYAWLRGSYKVVGTPSYKKQLENTLQQVGYANLAQNMSGMQFEIKILPIDKSDKIRYYSPTGSDNMYKYKFYEQDGKKILDKNTDMSMFLQKTGG